MNNNQDQQSKTTEKQNKTKHTDCGLFKVDNNIVYFE